MQAAKIYLEFLSLDPDPESDAYYRAKFGLASALFKDGVYSGAQGPTLEVLMSGPDKPHFVDAFYMLRTLTRENGYEPPQLQDLTKFYIENLSIEFQDDFHYYLGKFFYNYKQYELAFTYLEKVTKDSPNKGAALYLTGVAQIDPEVKKYRSAVGSFQNAILTAERVEDTDPEIRELAYLALARVAYEATNYDGALYYYNKIPRLSPRRATALFESSWTYFLKNDYNRAMGAFHSLHSPYYEQWYYPDLYILESTVYLNLCKFQSAKGSIVAFKTRFIDQQPLLQNFLQNTVNPEEFYNALSSIYEKKNTGEDIGLPMIFAQGIYSNIDFFNSHRVINNLVEEEAKLQANLAGLGDFGAEVLERVQTARKTQLLDAGIKINQALTVIDQELTDWSVKASEIEFDIGAAEADKVKAELINPDYIPPSATEGTTLFVVADDWQYWPFEGEYWVDEIGNYRSFLNSECIEQ
jgi:tetratricopeptide (TPR) repeat protein